MIDPDNGRITAQYPVGREPGGDRLRRRLGVGRQHAGRDGVADRPRGRPGRARSTSAASRPRSPSAPARCGSPNGESRTVAQVDPRLEPGRAASSMSATRRAASPWAAARCGSTSAVDGARPPDRPRPDASRRRSIDDRREPDCDRGRRRRDLGGERGVRHRHPPRPAPGRVVQRDPRRQRAERRRERRGRGVGRQPARRHASRGSTRDERRVMDGPGRAPTRRDRGRRRRRLGRRGRHGHGLRIDPGDPRVSRHRSREQRLRRSRSPAASVWASAVAPPASHRGGTLRVITWQQPAGSGADRLASTRRPTTSSRAS